MLPQNNQLKIQNPLRPPAGGSGQAKLKVNTGDDKKKDEKSETDTAADMQKQMALISPIMFAWFAFQFPLGLALYWNVFGLFGIMQQIKINKSK
jgi:membrane protein insertase Oxa1/YidC/SpoIIIJ